MSFTHTTHPPFAAPPVGAATSGATRAGLLARITHGFRFAVEVVRDAREMEAAYRREHRYPFHGW
jgi:hypothetical protein